MKKYTIQISSSNALCVGSINRFLLCTMSILFWESFQKKMSKMLSVKISGAMLIGKENKMKTYNAKSRISQVLRNQILETIETHDKYRNSFFWTPARTAGNRRQNEKRFPLKNYKILTKDGVLEVQMSYKESCNHIYYGLNVSLDGFKVTIRNLKNFLKKVITQ